MKYNGVNFYEESIKGQSFKEFKDNHRHLKWSDEELKQVHSLINKKRAAEAEPPSENN